jgi:hypothetical protein
MQGLTEVVTLMHSNKQPEDVIVRIRVTLIILIMTVCLLTMVATFGKNILVYLTD